MALSTQTLQFLRWIVDASSKQEANDLISAAVRQRTWRPHHAEKAVSIALGKSQWERAILIAETAAESGHLPEPQVYNKLVGALLTRWKSDAAWSCVFRRVQKSNVRLAEDVVTMLERHCAKNPERTKLLIAYKKQHSLKTER